MGKTTDASGRKWDRYRVGQKTVPTKGRFMRFVAFRGPVPASDTGYHRCRDILRKYFGSYGGRSLEDPPETVCARLREEGTTLDIAGAVSIVSGESLQRRLVSALRSTNRD